MPAKSHFLILILILLIMSVANSLLSDPIYLSMGDHTKSWGDMFYLETNATPVLMTRKDIWTQYPVFLVPLGSGSDGAERHALLWDPSRLTNWKTTDDAMVIRLRKALADSPKWVVESPLREDHICVIRMVYKTQNQDRNQERNMNQKRLYPIPRLSTLKDIYKHYPVVSHPIHNNQIHSIELYKNRIRMLSNIKGYDVTEEMKEQILDALRASASWRVLRAELPSEVCRLEMA